MSSKNTNKKNSIPSVNLNTITNIVNLISAAFSVPQAPVIALPPALIISGSRLRPGLSKLSIKSNIISRLSEADLPVGDVFADGPNSTELMISIIVDTIVDSILNEAVVNVAIQPGVRVTTIGVGNLGAPVVSQGATTSIAVGNGIIR